MIEDHWSCLVGLAGSLMVLTSVLGSRIWRTENPSAVKESATTMGLFLILVSLYSEFNLPAFFAIALWFAISLYRLFSILLCRTPPAPPFPNSHGDHPKPPKKPRASQNRVREGL